MGPQILGWIYFAIWSQNIRRGIFHSLTVLPTVVLRNNVKCLYGPQEKNARDWQCWVTWETALRLKGMVDHLPFGGVQKAIKFLYGA